MEAYQEIQAAYQRITEETLETLKGCREVATAFPVDDSKLLRALIAYQKASKAFWWEGRCLQKADEALQKEAASLRQAGRDCLQERLITLSNNVGRF